MAINLVHRPDLEEKIEILADRLSLIRRGRKTRIIELALKALEKQLDSERPSPEHIQKSLKKYTNNGRQFRERMYKAYPDLRGKDLSLALDNEFYDERGLPK